MFSCHRHKLLYVLYTAERDQVVAHHGMSLHQYADDSQIYISVALEDTAVAVQTFAFVWTTSTIGCAPAEWDLMRPRHSDVARTGSRRCEHITPVLRELHGFPSDNVSTLKSLACHTSHCLVRHLSISRQTSNSSQTVVAVISFQHLTGDASFPAHRIPSATEVFASPDHACGTGFLDV